MKTVNSLSGGKTSSYVGVHFPADYNIFCLVRTNDKNCLFPDKKVRQVVSDKIGVEFVGTLEMDTIVYTMLDLEQFIGEKIIWLTGDTFENLLTYKENNLLPSPMRRYCTQNLKLKPTFEWWQKEINEVCEMRIGFRANEQRRANNMKKRLTDGVMDYKHVVGQKNGRNIWKTTLFQKPVFPLISVTTPIFKDDIEKYWENKEVRFAELNNCVGCFHRSIPLLKKMWQTHENKMEFFNYLEKNRKYNNDTFKMDDTITYEKIKNWKTDSEFNFSDFTDCDSGFCEVN